MSLKKFLYKKPILVSSLIFTTGMVLVWLVGIMLAAWDQSNYQLDFMSLFVKKIDKNLLNLLFFAVIPGLTVGPVLGILIKTRLAKDLPGKKN